MPRELPEVQELFAAIADCLPLAVTIQATVFRSAGIRYSTESDFLSGNGAAKVGGRWNPPGLRAVYASLDPVTATKESYQNFSAYGFKKQVIKPRVFIGADVDLHLLLDLSNRKVLGRLGFSITDLVNEDWHAIQSSGEESWTQAIGRGCFLAGFEGLLAPSARDLPKGRNLVYFPQNLMRGSSVELLGKDELPKHPQ